MKSSFKRVLIVVFGVLSLLLSVNNSALMTTTGVTFMGGTPSEFRMESGLSIHMGYHPDNCNSSEVYVPYSSASGKSIGLCVEKARRSSVDYGPANAICISFGKRLMDYREWRFACDGKTEGSSGTTRSGLENIDGSGAEWASSNSNSDRYGTDYGAIAVTAGEGFCAEVGYAWVRKNSGVEHSLYYRCAR